ncbi:uncharacterized protein LOC132790918 [Drosophila nasuta]|uniref:Uncharacterized protein LOC117569184 n=1 Tax=Drosophila albomicans TaxID=7291 RepID=A0A6P8X333_DROAB|nr:uncharacterized protein LOC117569184 [Drosophila albomicans]XP_060655659.1 uncharacterized protein LOC132790918 [Drosophila nasuta]
MRVAPSDFDWPINSSINYISNELERTHLARSPQVLQELNSITEPWNEMGQAEGARLKQQSNVDL